MLKQSSNFEKSKLIIKALVGQHLTAGEYSFCLYLLDQQYGYSSSKGLNGDSSGYGHIGKITGFSADRVKAVVRLLTAKNIVLKEIYVTKYGNRYRFNENIDDWHNDVTCRTRKRKGIKKGSKICATSIAEDTSVVLPIIPPAVLPTPPSVVLPVLPNSRVSTINNQTVDDQTINDKDLRSHLLQNIKRSENTGITDDALSSYMDLLRRSYANLDFDKEYEAFQMANQNLKDNKEIGEKFTAWLINAADGQKLANKRECDRIA